MTDMEDFVDIRVTRAGREIASGRYKVPVTFGRMAQNSIPLGDDPYDNTVSRIHAQIDRVAGRLRLLPTGASTAPCTGGGCSKPRSSIFKTRIVSKYAATRSRSHVPAVTRPFQFCRGSLFLWRAHAGQTAVDRRTDGAMHQDGGRPPSV